jgi:hypothetical protein
MKAKRLSVILLAALALAAVSCYRPYGYHLYPQTPRFAPTPPPSVELLRREPRRDHIQLGEVWIRPNRWADRYYVEGVLREKASLMGADALVIVADRYSRGGGIAYDYWHGPRRINRRQIVGIAIRYRR